MDRKKRIKIIQKIEKARGSRLVVYITGDRKHMETKIASDIFPLFYKHLLKFGEQKRIDLYLYSTGGITMAGYALVNLFREYCDEFNVIIPFKALSCATLISLGANEIVMTKMGQLSPIDPSIQHPLAPVVQLPGQPPAGMAPVSVEDVNAFIDLAKEEIGLKKETSMQKVFEILASKINPLVLGAIHRSRAEIAFLAKTLMKYHIKDDGKIKNCMDILIRKRFSHSYIINRNEAETELKLNIEKPSKELDELILELYSAYNEILLMDEPYHDETLLGNKDMATGVFYRAIIESSNMTHVFKTEKEVKRIQVPQPGMPQPLIAYQSRILSERWVEDKVI